MAGEFVDDVHGQQGVKVNIARVEVRLAIAIRREVEPVGAGGGIRGVARESFGSQGQIHSHWVVVKVVKDGG